MSIALATFLAILAVSEDTTDVSLFPDGWTFGYICLFDASALGYWKSDHPVMDSTFIDAAVSVSVESPELDLFVTGAMRNDSLSNGYFRRGRCVLKWPGTPWIGAGVFKNDRQPFIAGLGDPVVEWGTVNIDSIQGFGVSSGGILGFSGEYSIQLSQGDTLSQLSVNSPWMGFAGMGFSRMQIHTADSIPDRNITVSVLSARGDFHYFNPWFVYAGADNEEGKWAFAGEIRQFSPFNTSWGRIEVVPGINFAGDEAEFPGIAFVPGQRVISLGAFLESRRYFFSTGIRGMLDLSSDSLSGVSASAGLLSESGVSWDLMLNYYVDGDYRAHISSLISDSYASAGLLVEIVNDSTRVTGSASYTPREDVCAEFAVSGDIDDSLQPVCDLSVSAAVGPVTGLLGIEWECDGSPILLINLRGLLK